VRRVCLAITAAIWCISAPSAQQARSTLDLLLDAYAAGDTQILERTVTTNERFEKIRKELRDDAADRWLKEWRPITAVFFLDLATVAVNRNFLYWLDVLKEGRNFVVRRPTLIGANPQEDAFEIAWHKTSVALLEGVKRPDFVDEQGIAPLARRIVAVAPTDPAAAPRLVDPWIELARGFVEEQWTLLQKGQLRQRGQAAIAHYQAAAEHESTRAEALVRLGWTLVRLGRPADALVELDKFSNSTDDASLRYWNRLFRGRAFEVLDLSEDASREYRAALEIVPRAQTPTVALSVLELRRDQQERAFEYANDVRTAPARMTDPWWVYNEGDFRFFKQRMIELRAMARR
jgi:tetratricopeptide (TPR) repeat protein